LCFVGIFTKISAPQSHLMSDPLNQDFKLPSNFNSKRASGLPVMQASESTMREIALPSSCSTSHGREVLAGQSVRRLST
jgi:hypothetical protein